jgi:hypothetical protein
MNGRGASPQNVVPLRRPAPAIEPFRPTFVSQLEGWTPAPRPWIVDGLLLRRTVCLFAGPPKVGKSLLLQQLLSSVATGIPFLSHPVERCRAFGMFTEDPDDELRRRQLAINKSFDRQAGDWELDFSFEAREGKSATLVEFERFSDFPKFTPLWDQLWDFVADTEIGVVGIDTAAVVFGGNENFRSQVTNFMRALVQRAVRHECAVCLTAHPSKLGANSYSGSTAWLGSARFAMSLGRPADYDPDVGPHHRRVLRGLGANYGAGLDSERLEYRDGIFELSEPEEPAAKRAPLNHVERADLEYRVLAGVKHVIANGGKIPADTILPASIPYRARRSPNQMINRVALNDLVAAQEALVEAGRLVRVSVGKRCLLRPQDGPYYHGEQPWLDLTSPPGFV